jgi:uncharacterized YccA/Bax inhibitor family protein
MSSRGTGLLERSSNPTLRQDAFKTPPPGPTLPAGVGLPPDPFATARTMRLQGVINKTALLLALTVATASWAWLALPQGLAGPLLLGGVIVGLVLAVVTFFRPQAAPVTAPLYAVVQGVVLGVISELYEARYGGITLTAVALTFATMGAMLLAYTTRLIRVTQRFRAIVVTATLGILATYLVSLVMRLFGAELPVINDPTPLGILVSLVIVGVAALNLVLDFDFIARGVANGAPRRMEWYGAFALLVTLIWLYLELLRLLSKLRR